MFDRFFSDPVYGSDIPVAAQVALRTAAAEIAANIIEHACGHLTDSWMTLRIEVRGERVEVEFEDRGVAYTEVASNPIGNLDFLRGRGMVIARAAVDTVEYSRVGEVNRWRLTLGLSKDA